MRSVSATVSYPVAFARPTVTSHGKEKAMLVLLLPEVREGQALGGVLGEEAHDLPLVLERHVDPVRSDERERGGCGHGSERVKAGHVRRGTCGARRLRPWPWTCQS